MQQEYVLLEITCNNGKYDFFNNNLLIYKISSTCFGQSFAHHQERETEIFYSIWYPVVVAAWHYVPRCRSPSPCPPQQ
jgi:hypothetical protein